MALTGTTSVKEIGPQVIIGGEQKSQRETLIALLLLF